MIGERVQGTITRIVTYGDLFGNGTLASVDLQGTLDLGGDPLPFDFYTRWGDTGEDIVWDSRLSLGDYEHQMLVSRHKAALAALHNLCWHAIDDNKQGHPKGTEHTWKGATPFALVRQREAARLDDWSDWEILTFVNPLSQEEDTDA